MHAKSLVAVLAAGVSAVAAQSTLDGTTTSTVSQTQTITITRCNPTVTNCPARNTTSSSAWYPTYNSTSVYWPTSNVTTYATPSLPPSPPPATSTSVVTVNPTTSTPAPPPVHTSGARSLFAQPGLLLSVVAAGVAMLA